MTFGLDVFLRRLVWVLVIAIAVLAVLLVLYVVFDDRPARRTTGAAIGAATDDASADLENDSTGPARTNARLDPEAVRAADSGVVDVNLNGMQVTADCRSLRRSEDGEDGYFVTVRNNGTSDIDLTVQAEVNRRSEQPWTTVVTLPALAPGGPAVAEIEPTGPDEPIFDCRIIALETDRHVVRTGR